MAITNLFEAHHFPMHQFCGEICSGFLDTNSPSFFIHTTWLILHLTKSKVCFNHSVWLITLFPYPWYFQDCDSMVICKKIIINTHLYLILGQYICTYFWMIWPGWNAIGRNAFILHHLATAMCKICWLQLQMGLAYK